MATLASIAVFADCGVTPHQAQYRAAGAVAARHGMHVICTARNGQWPQALVDSALAEDGVVTVVSGPSTRDLRVPGGVSVQRCDSEIQAGIKAVQMAQAVIGMPGCIETTAALYAAWTGAGGAASQRPVGLFNRDRAFEVVRGFAADIAGVGRGNIDTLVQFSDNFEDLLNRLTRLV
ncbi:hypothetical protein [Pelagibacterium lacus]|uniref:AMP nucleosidase n=1 Tax=Pelagibacterium lacus TaxID=2282655 RepID=A0A369WAT8_9HYPH|nr:hypothetical protein [Pelagibacterium lacus]RDE10510.1 hypothetical protein DVH29_00735 [Pelagibacterium lacus]